MNQEVFNIHLLLANYGFYWESSTEYSSVWTSLHPYYGSDITLQYHRIQFHNHHTHTWVGNVRTVGSAYVIPLGDKRHNPWLEVHVPFRHRLYDRDVGGAPRTDPLV